jgi:hypothetical protein
VENVWLGESSAMAQVRSNPDPTIFNVGNENTPIIVLDDFLLDTQSLIDIATNYALFFTEKKTTYPGLRADLPAFYIKAMLKSFEPIMRDVYELAKDLRITQSYGSYSLVATPEHDLGFLQRIPHCDTSRPHFFAMMLYLNPGMYGGTCFYRHNPTGFERVSEERFPSYMEAAKQYINKHGMPVAQYYKATDGHFSAIGSVDYKPNRVVIYPGNLLHSGIIDSSRDVNADPKTGRLTANIFIEFA